MFTALNTLLLLEVAAVVLTPVQAVVELAVTEQEQI